MRRVALLVFGVLAVTWLQFEYFPGHSYLEGESQLYVPMLERLDAPGYLSRDLVAAHPDVAYTIYDEVTLFLHEVGHLTFQKALERQQLVCRAAAVTGVLLLAVSSGVGDLLAFLIATFVNFGAVIWGPALLLIAPEPVPIAFGFSFLLLSAGLLAEQKPLLAGLAGGTALIYDPSIAAPFCGIVLLAFLVDKRLRRPLRPTLTVLVIFVLLLANLAQLQPGVVESAGLLRRMTETLTAIERYRTPQIWVSLWAAVDLWSCLAVYVCGVWASARIWKVLNRQMRWLLIGLPLAGVISIPFSYIALEKFRWYIIPEIQPTRALLFTIAFSSVACGIAGSCAALGRKYWEASLWFLVVIALPVNSRILDLLRVNRAANLLQLVVCLALAAAVTVTVSVFRYRSWRLTALLAPCLVVCLVPRSNDVGLFFKRDQQSLVQLASWAETGTWGSSVFLFPDAGRELYPGVFRAESRRAVWVDWSSGALVDGFESVAEEWWERWQGTMQGEFSAGRLQNMLSLPIDYYVLKRSNRLETVRPVFLNREFVVYDAADLRRASDPLRLTVPRSVGLP